MLLYNCSFINRYFLFAVDRPWDFVIFMCVLIPGLVVILIAVVLITVVCKVKKKKVSSQLLQIYSIYNMCKVELHASYKNVYHHVY